MMAAACTRVVWIRKRTTTTPKPTPVTKKHCVSTSATDAAADNYDAGANADDGMYTGCMDEAADNYDPQANTGDQTAICLYTGCYDDMAELRCPGEHG